MIKMTSIALLGLTALAVAAIAACSSDTTGATTATSTTGTAPLTLDCATYCGEIMTNCKTQATQQYADATTCEATCKAFPPGTLADMAGNTLGCREYHGGAPAAGDPATHCPHAGPGGDVVCGTNCEGFCEIAMTVCAGAMAQYTSAADCATKCAAFDNTVPYNSSVVSGDNLACRIYHATAASVDPTTHCPHIGVVSAVCK